MLPVIAFTLCFVVAGLDIDSVLCFFFFSSLLSHICEMLECDSDCEIDGLLFVAFLMAALDRGGDAVDGAGEGDGGVDW
jgi:hypothetical protein